LIHIFEIQNEIEQTYKTSDFEIKSQIVFIVFLLANQAQGTF